ncbi:hypothetical protein PR003_g28018 [Phytophthora rubi]|uniref:Uncharacterized protein n=1 Tax=Phytophthora rubi TaxID=129364 RepID=A0A6A4BTF8_9STRA|nr:hypothetical protein PR003_g28018 [Phytophthora rubi]
MRKTDEIRAQCYLGALEELQEAEVRAKQAELQRVHNERAAKIRAEYDVELLRLKEEYAEAQAVHEQAVAEREKKLRQLRSAQGQFNTQDDSRIQMSHSTGLLNPARVPTKPPRVSTVNDPGLVKLDQLIDIMYHMVQANQRQVEPVESRDKTTTARNSSQNTRTKSSARIPASASRRSSKAFTSRSKTPDDNDWGSDGSRSSDSSQDKLERQFGAAAQAKSLDAGSGTRVVDQAMVPHDALEKFVRDPVGDGPKSQALCAFAYVGPALPCWCSDDSKCMSSVNQASDYPSLTEVEDASSELEFENNVEFALIYGDRYGWWSDHVLVGGKRDTAMVHGAIYNRRTQIVMDTGAMMSIMSLV